MQCYPLILGPASSQRLCAISLTLHNSLDNSSFAILFVCVYFPTDYSNVASHTAFAESIGELDGIISAENFDDIIIAGDFNTDLSRPGSNFTTLTSFMSSHKLVCVDKLYNINFTYRKDDFSCFSSPDHILTYSNFSNLIDSVFTLDPVENFSDHLPLHFSLKLPDFLSFSCPHNSSVNSHCHPNHSHAQSSSSVNWFKVNPHHISSYCRIIFLPAFLNFLMTSLIVVTLTALFTKLILTATVSNFLTVLRLLQSFVSPHRVTAYDMLLSLVGIDLHIPSSNLLSSGTKVGLNVDVQPLVSYSRLRRTAKGDSSMRFVDSAIAGITFNVKT